MSVDFEKVITDKAEEIRTKFRDLLDKTNKEHPNPKDLEALSDMLSGNRKLELWRDVASAGYLAEVIVIENANATAGLKECWKHRLQVMKKDLGYDDAPMLEQLLIQQAGVVLAQTQPCRVELFRHNEAIDHPDPWHVLGKKAQRGAKAIYARLRDSRASPKTVPQYAGIAVQYRDEWRPASERCEVDTGSTVVP